MKSWYNWDSKNRVCRPGEKVLLLVPLLGCSLQARFSCPYIIKERVGDLDHIVATPDCRRRHRLCHVNMLKLYYERVECLAPEIGKSPMSLSSAEPVSPPTSLVKGAAAAEPPRAERDSSLSIALTEGSLWSSPCLLVVEANGDDRFCMDTDCFPLPHMEDCVEYMRGGGVLGP